MHSTVQRRSKAKVLACEVGRCAEQSSKTDEVQSVSLDTFKKHLDQLIGGRF